MTDQEKTETATFRPTVEQVREGMKNIEPFIPGPLKELHEGPATELGKPGPYKSVTPYTRGMTGGPIENSFYVNSWAGPNTPPGVSVSLGEYSHYTGWNYLAQKNIYVPQNSANINVNFTGTPGEVLTSASIILAIPEPPPGYIIREGTDGRSIRTDLPDVHSVQGAIEAALKGNNQFAVKHIRELSSGSIWVHVDIGGGRYTETVYYDKVK